LVYGLILAWLEFGARPAQSLFSVSHELVFGFLVNLSLTSSRLCLVACIFDAITMSYVLGEVTDLFSVSLALAPSTSSPTQPIDAGAQEALLVLHHPLILVPAVKVYPRAPPCVIDLTNQFDCGSYQ